MIDNLKVEVEGKKILQGVSLKVEEGEVVVLLGPNASGKSSLAKTLMGFEEYKIIGGEIRFKGKLLNNKKIEDRVKLGMVLSWQSSPVIKGVSLEKLIEKTAKKRVKVKEFGISEKLLKRDLNQGFSGGEKKLVELMQVVSLNPSLVILDEIDAGLDVLKIKQMIKIIKTKLVNNGVGVLVITHQEEVLKLLKPKKVLIMVRGKIVCKSKNYQKVWRVINQHGYDKCKKCRLLTDR
ncbi:MAG: ATP-binding cassette domain-containing protein [Candidatus Beckwithbacteria bacterium]